MFYVVQESVVFGCGETPEAAIEDAREWVDAEMAPTLSVETMPRLVGTAMTGARDGRKWMTDQGEYIPARLTLMDREDALRLEVEGVQ